MSREIKFRAAIRDDKEWLMCPAKMMMDMWYVDFEGNGAYDGEFEQIDGDFEVMQYTGLKDKAGVEIYEGDIVEHVSTSFGKARGVVEFFARNRGPEFEITWFEGSPRGLKWSEYEVIGNRFESELTEGKE